SVTAIVKLWVVNAPLASAALTVIEWLVEVSYSRWLASATLTTPVEELMANRPPALSLRLKVTAPPLTSLDAAVIPTRSPFAAPRSEERRVGTELSVGVEGATSVTEIVKLWRVNAMLGSSAMTAVEGL